MPFDKDAFVAALGDGLADLIPEIVARAVEPLSARIALLQKRFDEQEVVIQSYERRLSRNADHAARLEDRMRAVEQKGHR